MRSRHLIGLLATGLVGVTACSFIMNGKSDLAGGTPALAAVAGDPSQMPAFVKVGEVVTFVFYASTGNVNASAFDSLGGVVLEVSGSWVKLNRGDLRDEGRRFVLNGRYGWYNVAQMFSANSMPNVSIEAPPQTN